MWEGVGEMEWGDSNITRINLSTIISKSSKYVHCDLKCYQQKLGNGILKI